MPFTLTGPRWDRGEPIATVSWSIDASIPSFFMSEITDAFATWSRYANITFMQNAPGAAADIVFSNSSIDGANNVLARATTWATAWTDQGSYIRSTIMFDSGEGWRLQGADVVTSRGSSDLYLVALHEVGHVMGIAHTTTATMVMNPSIASHVLDDLTIHDIQAGQAIYGIRAGAPPGNEQTGFIPVPPLIGQVPTTPIIPITLVTPIKPVSPTDSIPTTPVIPMDTAPIIPTIPLVPPVLKISLPPKPLEDTTDPVFRFYDTKTGDHFYTAGVTERDAIIKNIAHYTYEGIAFETPDKALDTVDVFRFYNTATDAHFFTSSVGERDSVIKNLATYKYEGVAFQAYASPEHADAVMLDRFYNTATKMHHYSTGGETAGIVAGNAGPRAISTYSGS